MVKNKADELKEKLGINKNPLDKFKPAPAQAPTAPPQAAEPPGTTGVQEIRDDDTGRLSGFVDKRTGKSFVGLSQQEARSLIEKINQRDAITPGATGAAQARTLDQNAGALSETSAALQQSGAFDPAMQGRELSVPGVAGSNLKAGIIGGPAAMTQKGQAIRNALIINSLDPETIKNLGVEGSDVSDEFLTALVKTEIDRKVLESGEAKASRFGAFVEAIPLAGTAARRWIGGISTPGKAVDDMNAELRIIEGDLRNQGTWANQATLDPAIAIKNAQAYEERVQILESKIRFFIAQSPELRSSPEEVDAIMQRIQGIYNLAAATRERAAQGSVKQAINPDQVFLTLQEIKGGSNVNSEQEEQA